ncbi:10535_t:CDS:2, partial [Dentiscutata heterogama]
DQPVTFLEEFQNNISFAEYGDGDNLAAIWADLWMDVNVANNQQTYDWDDLISMNTIYNNIIAGANHSNTILDNFLTIEGNHINAIQGDLNNLTNVGEDYLAAIYDDLIDIEHLAATYDNPIDVERLTTIYDDPINIEEEHLATVQDDTIDVEKNIVQNENINLLDNEGQWARHNAYLQSLLSNQALSVVEPIFHEVFELIKKYLPSHILSVQKQQIEGSLLYRATLISKESASLIEKDLNQLDYDDSFLEDQLDRPQTSLYSLLVDIQPSDIVEQNNNVEMMNNLHLFNKFRPQCAFTNLNCEDEFLDMISNFITRKKSSIESTSNEENLCVLDPLVQKQRGRRPNKRIKSATEKSYHSSSENSAINPPDPNLTSRVANNENQTNTYVSDLSVQKRRGRPPKSVSEKKANQNNSNNVLLNVSDYEDTNVRTQPMQQRYVFRNPLRTLNSNDIHIQEKTDKDDTDENGDDVSDSDKSFIVDENIVK